jgi:hypothetical protein
MTKVKPIIVVLFALSVCMRMYGDVCIGLEAGIGGPAYQSGWWPAAVLKAEYAFDFGLRVGANGSYTHRQMPESAHFHATHAAVRTSYYFGHLIKGMNHSFDFYVGTGVGCYSMYLSEFGAWKHHVFVPVYTGIDWQFVPGWSLLAEFAYNDIGLFKIGLGYRF